MKDGAWRTWGRRNEQRSAKEFDGKWGGRRCEMPVLVGILQTERDREKRGRKRGQGGEGEASDQRGSGRPTEMEREESVLPAVQSEPGRLQVIYIQ